MASDQLFIGIDTGTQGTKAVVVSVEKKAILAQAYQGYELVENAGGCREQDPAIWTDACNRVVARVLASTDVDANKVCAIGVSGQQHGMVPLDRKGDVIRPAKLWCDTETESQCRTLTQSLGGPEKVIELIGNRIAVGFTASKLLWLKEKEPESWDRLATVLLPHDYINFWLTGEKKAEPGDASGTAYYDVVHQSWSSRVISAIDDSGRLAQCLPPLISSIEPVGKLRPQIAAELGLSPDVIVSSGGGDNMMAAVGTGNIAPGVVTASLGTSGTIYAFSASPVIDPKGEVAAFCSSSGGWLPLVCTMNVTVATELFRSLFSLSLDSFNHYATAARRGADGVILLPFFNGERTPALPKAKASLHGMTSMNMTRENLCRAAMEGVTFGLLYGLEALKRCGINPSQIRLTGGGSKSPAWRQMVADIFNCHVVLPKESEAGALGGAIQAMWSFHNAKGRNVSLKEITDHFVFIDGRNDLNPDPIAAKEYQQIYESYLGLVMDQL
jgi:D-xylulose kinase